MRQLALLATAASLLACAGGPKLAGSEEPVSEPVAQGDASSTQSAALAPETVDSLKLEWIWERYRQRFPNVSRAEYFQLARGKQQETFCLFGETPAEACREFADFENDNGRKQSARDAYQAALLSEGYNSSRTNLRLYGSMAQLALEDRDLYSAQQYLNKILSLEPENQWAKQRLGEILSGRHNP